MFTFGLIYTEMKYNFILQNKIIRQQQNIVSKIVPREEKSANNVRKNIYVPIIFFEVMRGKHIFDNINIFDV